MGQQQLLLLVLATVIVGLATVAGIQAFNENQAQASQDALVQRATSIASDIKGLQGKPTQLGGIDIRSESSSVPDQQTLARKLGLEKHPFSAQGAGNSAACRLTISQPSVNVQCESADAPQDVQVQYNADDDDISTSFGGGYGDIEVGTTTL